MDEIIDRLQKENDIDLSEFFAIPEKLNQFDLDDMSKVEKLRDAYFGAVDKSMIQNANANGIDEENVENSKKILKYWLLEKLYNERIVFDPETNKPRKAPQSKKNRESTTPNVLFQAATGKAPDIRIYKTPTNKNPTDLKTVEIQDKRENLKERMDSKFKVDIHILFDNCNLDPLKSYASQLLTMLIDQLPVEILDRKLPEKDRGITQESFQILIGGKIKNISSQSTEKPFPNYNEMVKYFARKDSVYSHQKKLNNDQIYLIERDILLRIIRITWQFFTKNERKIFILAYLIMKIYLNLGFIWGLSPAGGINFSIILYFKSYLEAVALHF